MPPQRLFDPAVAARDVLLRRSLGESAVATATAMGLPVAWVRRVRARARWRRLDEEAEASRRTAQRVARRLWVDAQPLEAYYEKLKRRTQ